MEAISAIIGIIFLIVFLVMADNLGKLKRSVDVILKNTSDNYAKAFNQGEIKELQGKKQEALDCYIEAVYLIKKPAQLTKEQKKAREQHLSDIESKISRLKGSSKE